MTSPTFSRLSSVKRWLFGVLYLAVIVNVLLWIGDFHRRDTGFTSLITIGDRNLANLHPALLDLHPHIERHSAGYDGQMYAQIAVVGDLNDGKLAVAVDNVGYRARRILWALIPRFLSLGNPQATLFLYSIQNVVCWLLLSVLLLRWFPVTGLRHAIGWCGVMLSMGWILSLRNALVEGPTLLILALGMKWFEEGKHWCASIALGTAGLGRETAILAGSIIFPSRTGERKTTWTTSACQSLLVGGPVIAWFLYLRSLFPGNEITGFSNFTYPLVDYVRNWSTILSGFSTKDPFSWFAVSTLVALAAQAVWFFTHPRVDCPWWRLGASFALLFCFLGLPVWEGYPGAAARVLLPLTFAFNVLVVREPRPFLWLLVGNLSLLFSGEAMDRFRTDISHEVTGAPQVLRGELNEPWRVSFSQEWTTTQQSFDEYWRWSMTPEESFTVVNPLNKPVLARIAFELKSAYPLHTVIRQNSSDLSDVRLSSSSQTPVEFSVKLLPGATSFFVTCPDGPPQTEPKKLPYVCLRNLRLEIEDIR